MYSAQRQQLGTISSGGQVFELTHARQGQFCREYSAAVLLQLRPSGRRSLISDSFESHLVLTFRLLF